MTHGYPTQGVILYFLLFFVKDFRSRRILQRVVVLSMMATSKKEHEI